MSNTNAASVLPVGDDQTLSAAAVKRSGWRDMVSSPLWICLLIAFLARLWVIVHTNGTMAGDEAMVGLQAEHILRGERPVYYYAQPYMGSLEAYLAAFTFWVTGGPTVWAMRVQTIPMGLLMTFLAWRFARTLAETARLSPRLKMAFMTIAALVAAFPPLYDMAEEMRVQGGYMGAFAIMMWLLLSSYRLAQRWGQQAGRRELALRWAGIGFLLGLGFWIDPLIVYACVAMAIWLVAFFVLEWRKRRELVGSQSRRELIVGALLCLSGVPTLLLGFTPGLIWGAQNKWINVLYIIHNAGASPFTRLPNIAIITGLYSYCLAPRAMGGSLPTQPGVTTSNPQIVTLGLVVVAAAFFLSLGSFVFRRRAAVFVKVRKLTALPLLFFGCASVIFCLAAVATAALASGCGPADDAGRYVVPLVDALPFLVATLIILPALIVLEGRERLPQGEGTPGEQHTLRASFDATFAGLPRLKWLQVGLIVLLVLYFGVQIGMYEQMDQNYTFQATGCQSRNPTNVVPIINYLEQEHIHDVWATGWIGDHINFNTDGSIIATKIGGRIPADVQAVLHAPHASILALALHSDAHPSFLDALDANHVTYMVGRFYSAPGVDALIVTPLNRTLSPFDPTYSAIFERSFVGCL